MRATTTDQPFRDQHAERDADPCTATIAELLRYLGADSGEPAFDDRGGRGFDFSPYAWDGGGEGEDDAGARWQPSGLDGGDDDVPDDGREGPAFRRAPPDGVDDDGGEHAWVGGMWCRICNDVPPGESDAEATLRVAYALGGGDDPVTGLLAETVAGSYVKFARAAQDAERMGHRICESSAAVCSFVKLAHRLRGILLEFVRNAWAFEVGRSRESPRRLPPLPGWAHERIPEREPIDRMSDDFNPMRALLLGDAEPGRFTIITALRRMQRAAFILFQRACHLSPSDFDRDGEFKSADDFGRLAAALRDLFETHVGGMRAERDFARLRESVGKPIKVTCIIVKADYDVPPVTHEGALLPTPAEVKKKNEEAA